MPPNNIQQYKRRRCTGSPLYSFLYASLKSKKIVQPFSRPFIMDDSQWKTAWRVLVSNPSGYSATIQPQSAGCKQTVSPKGGVYVRQSLGQMWQLGELSHQSLDLFAWVIRGSRTVESSWKRKVRLNLPEGFVTKTPQPVSFWVSTIMKGRLKGWTIFRGLICVYR